MNPNEIPYLSATELGGHIASKEISPLEAVEAYLTRIGEVDSKLNAYITVCADQAREEAPAGRRRDCPWRVPEPSARDTRGREGPDLCQGRPQLRRFKD